MGQVPSYLIIGNGRVARHFQHYFSLLQLPFTTWHRNESTKNLYPQLKQASSVLLLIRDTAIEEFMTTHLKNTEAHCVHFSGSHTSDHAHGAHPLMSFNEHLYDLETYQAIPFILDHDSPGFTTLLPGLPNQHAYLHKSLKEKYHALCVLSGNFSCLLWQKLFSAFENELHLPKTLAHLYLRQQTLNLITDHASALTGPLVRNDTATIEKNLASLTADPFQEVYKSFLSCYQQLNEKK